MNANHVDRNQSVSRLSIIGNIKVAPGHFSTGGGGSRPRVMDIEIAKLIAMGKS